MHNANRMRLELVGSLASMFAIFGADRAAESSPPSNDLSNPYHTVTNWAQLPDGRKWGSTAGVDIGPDGNVWAYDRCGANNCADSKLDPILEFDTSGKLLRHWGAGVFVFPHGFFVDKQGNVWVTDEQASKDGTRGLQVFKLSQDRKVLMTIDKAEVKENVPDKIEAPPAELSIRRGKN